MLLVTYISVISVSITCIYVCLRYLKISDYLNYLFETAKILNQQDIKYGKYNFWRMQYIKSHISYNKMMFMFWKPVEKIFDVRQIIRKSPPEE